MDRALLVGINKYSVNNGANNLQGCAADAQDVAGMLVLRGWSPDNIMFLTDEEATCAAVLSALEAMTAATTPTDRLVCWQSSHGALVAGADSSNDVGDEAICTTDFSFDDPSTQLTDSKFRAAIAGIPPGTLYCGFDCCHSGEFSERGVSLRTVKARFVQNPKLPHLPAARGNRFLRDVVPEDQQHVSLSGCEENETSGESYDEASGCVRGAMTLAFCRGMRGDPQPATWPQLLNWMQADIGGGQHPVLAGATALLAQQPLAPSAAQSRVIPAIIPLLIPVVLAAIQYSPAIINAVAALFKELGFGIPANVTTPTTWQQWLAQQQAANPPPKS